jgi:acyl-CoA synthetase (NDP forming)
MAALLEPRSIAIVGASPNRTSITGQPVQHLIDRHYGGRIYPVNGKHAEIAGLRCYASVADLPEAPDLAVLVVTAARVPAALSDCGQRGIPIAVIISGGFAELGEQGIALQVELRRIARRYEMRILGPNCQGMLNVAANVCAGFGPVLSRDYGVQPGGLAFITQSGGFGFGLVNLAAQQGIGFRCIVSTGNEADLTAVDFIEHFLRDEGTRAVAAYLEGVHDGRRLRALGAEALERDKPLLLWKAGHTREGQRAASSHTASIAGDAVVCRAVFRQIGAIEIEDADDLSDYTRVFASGKRPQGTRVAIFSASGGAGVLMCDECSKYGLDLAPLSDACRAALASVAPALGSLQNPIDVMGRIYDEPDDLRRALLALAAEPSVDSIVVVSPLRRGVGAAAMARAIVDVNASTHKPVLVSWAARHDFASEAYGVLDAAGVPYFDTPVRCARSLGVLTRYADARRLLADTASMPVPGGARRQALALLEREQGGVVTEHAAKQLLAQYGIPVTREHLAIDLDHAKRAAGALGYPVAMKLQSPDIAHKTEAGLVRLNIADESSLAAAYDDLIARAACHAPEAAVQGVLIQQMVTGGVETILGVTTDAVYGPVIMFGMGGVYAEVLHDVAFRMPPISEAEALAMIRETRCYAMLSGARGKPLADIDALARAIVALGVMAIELESQIAELDINPLAVVPDGQGVVALDALITLKTTNEPEEVHHA